MTDTKKFLSAVYNNGTQARKLRVDVVQYGRSMIEMLGVLAIAVFCLSVVLAVILKQWKNLRQIKLGQKFAASTTTSITNPFGGLTIIRGSGDTFSITLSEIPQSACVNLIGMPWDNDDSFLGIALENGSSIPIYSVQDAAYCQPTDNISFYFE